MKKNYHSIFSLYAHYKRYSYQTESIDTSSGPNNYPDLFNPTTQITYKFFKPSDVFMVVYNSLGEEIANLVNEYKVPGKYNIQFDRTNFPSGVYYYNHY